MDKISPHYASRRIRELRSIPENRRTDAEWDELNELEIVLAQENLKSPDRPGFRKPPGPLRHKR